MKKSYLMIAAAAALFAACQDTDTIKDVNQDVAIGFEGKYINKVTRAELTNTWFTTNGNKFGVYGFKGSFQLFNDEEVTYNSSNSTWAHNTVRFWDKGSNEYSFYAYAPYEATQSFSNSKTFSFASLPVIADIASANADIAISSPISGLSYAQTIDDTHGAGHVEFEFNHILSKLAFKVKTSSNANYAEIKVTAVDIDFPSGTATWTQDAASAVAGTTTYQSYSLKDAVSIENNKEVTDMSKFEKSVFSGTTAALTSTGVEIQDATTTTNKGKVFIVTPVTGEASGNGSEHVFGVKVTYNVQYKKLEGGQYVNDGNPEVGCIATGVVGGGNDAATQYKPTQNRSYVVTIDVNPEQIQFCVDKIVDWVTDLNGDTDGDGQPDPVEVK